MCLPEPRRSRAEFLSSRIGVQVNFRDVDEGCGHMTISHGQYARPETSMVAALLRAARRIESHQQKLLISGIEQAINSLTTCTYPAKSQALDTRRATEQSRPPLVRIGTAGRSRSCGPVVGLTDLRTGHRRLVA